MNWGSSMKPFSPASDCRACRIWGDIDLLWLIGEGAFGCSFGIAIWKAGINGVRK